MTTSLQIKKVIITKIKLIFDPRLNFVNFVEFCAKNMQNSQFLCARFSPARGVPYFQLT